MAVESVTGTGLAACGRSTEVNQSHAPVHDPFWDERRDDVPGGSIGVPKIGIGIGFGFSRPSSTPKATRSVFTRWPDPTNRRPRRAQRDQADV